MRNILLVILMTLIMGCNKSEIMYLCSTDKSQCITVINESKFRYIIDGKHTKLPDTNYIHLNLENVTKLGDAIYVCWKNERYEWEVTVNKSKVVESKLDTIKFNFNSSLPEDDRGIPNELKFRKDGCAIYSYYLDQLSPNKGAYVEYK